MRFSTTAPALALAVAATVALAACSGGSTGGSSAAAGKSQTLQVGMIDSLTGAASQAGTTDVCGAKVAVAAINDGKTANTSGVKVDLAVEDDQTNPSTGAAAASKLTSQGRQIFVGGATSAGVLATLPIIDDAGGMSTGGTSKAEEFLSGGKLLVRLNSDVNADAVGVAALAQSFKPTKVDMVYANNAFGTGAMQGLQTDLVKGIALKTISVDATQTNFDSVMSTINQDNPDVVVLALTGNPPISFWRAAKTAGLKAKIISWVGVLVNSYLQPSAGATDGVYGIDMYQTFFDNAANKAFLSEFTKYSPSIPECKGLVVDKGGALSYSQVLLVAQAAAKTGSSDPATLRKAIVAGTWDMPQGTVTFQANGQAQSKYTAVVGKEVDGKPGLVDYPF
jgi:ABC-type branched-subunit amino acid transport system substrate-binding protein